jgi:branched-chain amino acid transport system substrate-binding protein
MYTRDGKPAPKEMASTVFYNRGVLIAALHDEAIRNALNANPAGRIIGRDVKNGFEQIKGPRAGDDVLAGAGGARDEGAA